MRHARYIYAATARITLWCRTAQLAGRLDTIDIDKNVYRWVDRESDDVRHVRYPFQQMIGFLARQINLAKRK
jgi:hypothetical protein